MSTRSIFTALFTALVLALPAASAAAAGNSGAVVFSRVTEDSRTIELPEGKTEVRPAEGGLYAARNGRLNQLTENPGDSEPAFSADGRMIAFVRAGDIWVMRADGSGQRLLTGGSEIASRPVFHPRGRYLLFERRAGAGVQRDLYAISISGGNPAPVAATPDDEFEASFAPDVTRGRLIVYVRSVGGTDERLFVIGPRGPEAKRLPSGGPDAFSPRFYEGGIVFSRGRSGTGEDAFADVYTIRRDGKGMRPLVRGAGSAYVEDVTPNGRLALFRRDQGLWVKALSAKAGSVRARKLIELPDGSQANAVFSSDGREVAAFIATESASETRQTLTAISVKTRRQRTLADGFASSFGTVTTTIGPVISWQPAPSAR
jgi:Tol biopolymer transport system component